MKYFFLMILIILLLISVLYSCGFKSSSDNFSASTIATISLSLYSGAKEVAPRVTGSARVGGSARAEIPGAPDMINSIYSLIKDYDRDLPHAGQGVNMENFFRVLAAYEDYMEYLGGGCDGDYSLTAQIINAPYALFPAPSAYTCGVNMTGNGGTIVAYGTPINDVEYANGFAADLSDPTKLRALVTYRWSPTYLADGHYEHGVVEGNFDDTTKDLSIRNVHVVNYDSAGQNYSGFVVRTHVTGNVETNQFEFSTINVALQRTGGLAGGAWAYNAASGYKVVVGKGFAKATAADPVRYLLFKTATASTLGAPVYYCLQVGLDGIDYATMAAQDALGHTINAGSPCFSFKTDVDNLYDIKMDHTSVPYSIGNFTASTIFLNFAD